MRTLIADDDFTNRVFLSALLKPFGETLTAENGREAVMAFQERLEAGTPFELVFLDIMMPELDGQDTLREIRRLEEAHGILVGRGAKVIMTTALGDRHNVLTAFRELCDAYLVKPFSKDQIVSQLTILGLTNRDKP